MPRANQGAVSRANGAGDTANRTQPWIVSEVRPSPRTQPWALSLADDAGGMAGIMFQWSANAQEMEHGRILPLDAIRHFAAVSVSKRRAGKDLSDQFPYKYSVGKSGELHMLQVVFGKAFGFVTIFSQAPGRLESIVEGIEKAHPASRRPFRFLSSNRPALLHRGERVCA